MRTIGTFAAMLVAIAVGAVVAVGAQIAGRRSEAQTGWVVAVGGDSFVVLDDTGAPSEVCTVEVGETFCHPIRHRSELRRHPVERWHAGPEDTSDREDLPSPV